MFTFILIIILISLLIRYFLPYLLPRLFTYWIKKQQKGFEKQRNASAAGKSNLRYDATSNKSNIPGNVGEYVDFEEIDNK
jgi:hypothetical protein